MALFLDYTPPDPDTEDDETEEAAGPPTWLGGSSLSAPSDLVNAASTDEALAAAERLFFGEVKDVEQLRR